MAVGLMRRSFDRAVSAVRSYMTAPLTTRSPELARLWGSGATSTGIAVSEQSALTYSAFWACVNGLSTDVASLPLIHYKRLPNGGKDRYTDGKLYRILHDEPNPEMTSFTMRQIMQAHALTWGNGYAEIERDGSGKPLYLWPLTPDRVAPDRHRRTGEIVYNVGKANGGVDVIPAANMLHITGLGFDGLVGYSVVAKARDSIGLGMATERFGGTFFGNGATFGGVISYKGPRPTEMSDKNYRESLESKHQGVDRAHKLLALYNDATYTRMGIPPNDAQFLETRLHQVEEMCRWFRMPPHKIQHLLRSTNNNIEHQGIEYYTDTLRPWLVRWEQEINRKLIAPSERRIQFVEHMIDAVMRGDLASRYAAYAVARQWGWMSADDVLERENANPLPNGTGKIYLLPLNMVPADRIGEVIDKQVAPTPPPVVQNDNQPPPDNTTGRALDAIRSELSAIQERAESALTRASAADAEALRWKELAEIAEPFRAEAETLRREAETLKRQAAVLESLKVEAIQRADRIEAEREAAIVAAAAEASRAAAVQVEALTTRAVEAESTAADIVDDVGAAKTTLAETERKLHDATIRADEREAWVTPEDFAAAVADMTPLRESVSTLTAELDAARTALTEAEYRAAQEATARAAKEAAFEASATAERQRLEANMADQLAMVGRQAVELKAVSDEREAARGALMQAEERAAAEKATLSASLATERQRVTSVIAAHRGLIADAMGRMIRRETEKARRAQATPEKLRAWAESFYPVHEDICVTALLPAIRAHLAWAQSTDDPLVVTQAIVRAHVDESTRQIRMLLESDVEDIPQTLESTLRRWETERADAVADRILREAVDHVSRVQ